MTSLSTLVLLLWCSCVANSFRRVLNSQARGAAVSCRQETHSRGLAGHCSSSKEHRAIGATRAAWLGRGTALRAEFRQGSYSLGEDVAAVDALKLLEYSLLEFVGRSLSEELFDRNKIEYRWFSDYLDTFLAERVDGGGSGIGTVGSDEGPWAHSDLLVRDLLSQEVERLLLRKDAESSTGVSMTLSLYIYPSKFAKRIVELKSEAIRGSSDQLQYVLFMIPFSFCRRIGNDGRTSGKGEQLGGILRRRAPLGGRSSREEKQAVTVWAAGED